jgi:NF-kappa-B inhibitor-like protein 2
LKCLLELKSDKLVAKSKNQIEELIAICNCLGRKYLETQRYEEAINEHKEELFYSKQSTNELSEPIARRALGECYSEIGQHFKALKEHEKYLSLAQIVGNRVEIQRAFATIGRTHLLRAQDLDFDNRVIALNKALKAFLEALRLCDQ